MTDQNDPVAAFSASQLGKRGKGKPKAFTEEHRAFLRVKIKEVTAARVAKNKAIKESEK